MSALRTPTSTSADPGLFGPDSVTWRVISDPATFIGGLRALLQQSLHPDVVTGFQAHSTWSQAPWTRLTRTAEFVGLATYGDTESVLATAERVRRGHEREWIDPCTGRVRRLDEPGLLRWVHCCLVDSFLDAAVRAGQQLTPVEQDRFVAEQVRFGELVGLSAADLPYDRASLAGYFESMRPELRMTDEACDAVATLLAPRLPVRVELFTPARLGWGTLCALAVGTLPPWAREIFPLPTGVPVLRDAAVTTGLRAIRGAAAGVRSVKPDAGRGLHEREARARLGLDLDGRRRAA